MVNCVLVSSQRFAHVVSKSFLSLHLEFYSHFHDQVQLPAIIFFSFFIPRSRLFTDKSGGANVLVIREAGRHVVVAY